MTQLYTNLAAVYDAMYQTFINYEEEFLFYDTIRKEHTCNNVIEIGCGTGHLASLFLKENVSYTGLDMSEQMLSIAKAKNPGVLFMEADMRDFKTENKFDFCFAAARTVSYLITDADVRNAFQCMADALQEGGILCFDFIDATRFIPQIKNGYDVEHVANYKNKQYKRLSHWTVHDPSTNIFNWKALFYECGTEETPVMIGEDYSVLRTFTADDIHIFLSGCGLKVETFINKTSYAFDTLVVIAKKL
jgi:SAM-dependent methyltransferase